MKLDPQDLKRHYASLSDEGLLEINRDDLVEIAQQVYDEEVERRGLAEGEPAAAGVIDIGPEPDWLPDAALACTFDSQTGGAAYEARAALEAAGIPCHITTRRLESEDGRKHHEYDLMVPGALTLHAAGILDRDIFNPKQEEDWRAHFQELSDEDLQALDPEIFCAGLLDRIERLQRAYEDEIARRQTDA